MDAFQSMTSRKKPSNGPSLRRRFHVFGYGLVAWIVFFVYAPTFGGCTAPDTSRCGEDVCKLTLNRTCTANEDCCCQQACVGGVCVPAGSETNTETNTETTTEGVATTEETVVDGATEASVEALPDGSPQEQPSETPSPDEIAQEQPPQEQPPQEQPPQEQPPQEQPVGEPPICMPNQTRPCYDGPAGTQGQGECKAGTQTCTNNAWGPCQGQINPTQETCDGKDNNCDGKVDEGCQCRNGESQDCYTGSVGCTNQNGSWQCTSPCQKGTQTCRGNRWENCVGETLPQKETCDGNDNDCDGKVDEDFPTKGQHCTSGQGACVSSGKFVCKADGSGVECDASPSSGSAEICDGKDNDCDGQIDETFPTKGQSCAVGRGECEQTGTLICRTDGSGVTCGATPKAAKQEECNGKDDDCDGRVDEELARSCSSAPGDVNKGICRAGLQVCNNGQWGSCQGETTRLQEQCTSSNNPVRDEDCDGQSDENCGCQRGSQRSCGTDTGECRRGTQFCASTGSNPTWGACNGGVNPVPETCDGKDNNCNGRTDEDWPAKDGSCSVGRGECAKTGKYVCKADGSGLECDAKPGTPAPEVCDGKDNNCDGRIDENCP